MPGFTFGWVVAQAAPWWGQHIVPIAALVLAGAVICLSGCMQQGKTPPVAPPRPDAAAYATEFRLREEARNQRLREEALNQREDEIGSEVAGLRNLFDELDFEVSRDRAHEAPRSRAKARSPERAIINLAEKIEADGQNAQTTGDDAAAKRNNLEAVEAEAQLQSHQGASRTPPSSQSVDEDVNAMQPRSDTVVTPDPGQDHDHDHGQPVIHRCHSHSDYSGPCDSDPHETCCKKCGSSAQGCGCGGHCACDYCVHGLCESLHTGECCKGCRGSADCCSCNKLCRCDQCDHRSLVKERTLPSPQSVDESKSNAAQPGHGTSTHDPSRHPETVSVFKALEEIDPATTSKPGFRRKPIVLVNSERTFTTIMTEAVRAGKHDHDARDHIQNAEQDHAPADPAHDLLPQEQRAARPKLMFPINLSAEEADTSQPAASDLPVTGGSDQ